MIHNARCACLCLRPACFSQVSAATSAIFTSLTRMEALVAAVAAYPKPSHYNYRHWQTPCRDVHAKPSPIHNVTSSTTASQPFVMQACDGARSVRVSWINASCSVVSLRLQFKLTWRTVLPITSHPAAGCVLNLLWDTWVVATVPPNFRSQPIVWQVIG